MVGDYGVLNGQDIDWSGHSWRNRYELALWLVVPVVVGIFRAEGVFNCRLCQSNPDRATDGVARLYGRAGRSRGARQMGGSARGHLRAVFEAERLSLRARRVSIGCLSRHPQGRARRDRPPVLRLHVLQESHGRVSDHDREHPVDAHRLGLSQPGADAPVHRQGIQTALDLPHDARPGVPGRRRVGPDLRQTVDDELLPVADAVCHLRRVRAVCRLAARRPGAVPLFAAHAETVGL